MRATKNERWARWSEQTNAGSGKGLGLKFAIAYVCWLPVESKQTGKCACYYEVSHAQIRVFFSQSVVGDLVTIEKMLITMGGDNFWSLLKNS